MDRVGREEYLRRRAVLRRKNDRLVIINSMIAYRMKGGNKWFPLVYQAQARIAKGLSGKYVTASIQISLQQAVRYGDLFMEECLFQ